MQMSTLRVLLKNGSFLRGIFVTKYIPVDIVFISLKKTYG